MTDVLEELGRLGVVPVVKIERSKDAVELGRALLAGGLPCAEITFRTAAAEEAILRISSNLPEIIVGAVTGWDTNAWELWKAAERLVTMARAFNVRQGFTPADDRLPLRMAEPIGPDGPGAPIKPRDVEAAVKLYYEMMGWNAATGEPRVAKLYELDIGWVAETLSATARGRLKA